MESRVRKFTKEFKEAVARSVQEGTPIKEVARTYQLRPAAVRAWRDELRDLGADAFGSNKRRRFTKAFKEAAVQRVEQGTPVKEVARACRVHPTKVRRWRDALRNLGANAFPDKEPKRHAVIFRLNELEYHRLKALARAAGARSLSYFARTRLLTETAGGGAGMAKLPNELVDKEPKRRAVIFRLDEHEYGRLKALVKGARARSLSDFARSRVLYEAYQASR